MDSSQTLHDFVLNLLTDPQARSAFELDPEGALHDAGLSDITAADVQDVVPLVVDYAPVHGITALDPVGQDFGLSSLSTDPGNVIGQLQSVAHQFTVGGHATSADVNVAALGAITVDPTGLGAAASALSGIGIGAGASGAWADLSGVHDVAATLDGGVTDPIGQDVTGAVGTADGLVAGTVGDGALGTVDSTAHTVTGTLGHTTDLVGSLDVGGVTDSLGVGGLGHSLSGTGVASVPLPTDGSLDPSSVVSGVTHTASDTVHQAGVGDVLGGDLGVHSEAHASADSGVLGLTDGLL